MGRVRHRRTALCLLGVLTTACATGYLEKATPAVVGSGLEELVSEENKQRLKELGEIPDLRAAAREMAEGVIAAGREALDDPERRERFERLGEAFVERAAAALAEAVGSDLGPRFREELAAAVDTVLATLASAQSREELAAVSEAVVGASSRTFTAELAAGIDRDLTPALRRAVEELVAAVEESADGRLEEALGEHSRTLMRGAMLGLNDALEGELGTTLAGFEASSWARLETLLDRGKQTGRTWMRVLAAVAVILALGLGLVVQRWLAASQLAASREGSMALLTAAIRDVGRRGSVGELLGEIQRRGRDEREGYAALAVYLARHQELKVGHERE